MATSNNNHQCDPKTGCCIHHPHIQLRKRRVFVPGTSVVMKWKTVMTRCPECVIDGMLIDFGRTHITNNNSNDNGNEDLPCIDMRQQTNKRKRKSNSGRGRNDKRRPAPRTRFHCKNGSFGSETASTSASSLMTSLSRSSSIDSDEPRSIASFSDSSSCSSSDDYYEPRSLSPSARASRYAASTGAAARVYLHQLDEVAPASSQHESFPAQEDTSRIVVCSMPFQDLASGQVCSYTGQIDQASQLPSGMGTLVYNNNEQAQHNGLKSSTQEGEWQDGQLVRARNARSLGTCVKSLVSLSLHLHVERNIKPVASGY